MEYLSRNRFTSKRPFPLLLLYSSKMVDLERTIEPRTPSYLRKYIVKLFRLYRRLCADFIDYKVEYPRGHVSCWPDLVIKSIVEPKRCLILDVRESSLEVDRRVPGNRDEFPFPLPSCPYRAIFPHCCCNFRESSVVREKLSSHRTSLILDDSIELFYLSVIAIGF